VTYKTIVIDPPWNERGAGEIKRGADRHYGLMKTDEIIDVIKDDSPFDPDPEGCHLYLWVTNNYLKDGLRVVAELGFRYITNIAWVKDRIGIGQYFRGLHELCLFAVYRETDPLDTLNNSTPTVIEIAKTEHSQKPDEFRRLVEKCSPPPRLELFARDNIQDWDSWGDELPNSKQTRLEGSR